MYIMVEKQHKSGYFEANFEEDKYCENINAWMIQNLLCELFAMSFSQ